MIPVIKLLLFSHLFVISATICASKSIDNGSESDVRVFLYSYELPYIRYANESSFHDSKVLWTNRSNIVTLEYFPEEKTFFWTTRVGELYSTIWNENEDMTFEEFNRTDEAVLQKKENAKLLYSEENWYPRSMAVDEIGKKLYIVDAVERSIDVFDLDGKNKARIFTNDSEIPMEIAIDPNEGLLFLYSFNFYNKKTNIRRMNMDGTDHRLIIPKIDTLTKFLQDQPEPFTIDRVNQQLHYRKNSWGSVKVNYNGLHRVKSFEADEVAHIEVHRNRTFWAKPFYTSAMLRHGHLQAIKNLEDTNFKYEYAVYSCDISNNNVKKSEHLCTEEKVNESLKYTYRYSNSTSIPTLFKIVDLTPQKKLDNPCLENNGGCEDHCLLKPSGVDKKLSFGCACRVGRKLNDDEKTCSNITAVDKLLNESVSFVYEKVWMPPTYFYSEASYIFQKSVKNSYYPITKTFVEKFVHDGPEVARDDNLKEKFEVNANGELVKCQSDDKCITLRNSTEKLAKLLAYDWVSKNLYYAKLCDNSDKHNLFVLTAKYPYQEIFLGQIDSPTSMAVHPYAGYLFIATYDEKKNESHIIRFNTIGKDRIVFPYSNKSHILLTVDMAENMIYWIDGFDDEQYKFLRRSDLHGGDIKLIANKRFPQKLQLMKIYHNRIFVKASCTSVFYCITREGKLIYKYDITDNLEGPIKKGAIVIKLKIQKTDTQYLSLENPCVLNNGGCEAFCFAVPVNGSEKVQKVCGCSDEKKLDPNTLNCL